MDDLDEVISEFLVESQENLDALDQALVSLEQHPDPAEIGRIFRAIHTVKGTAGFLGFGTLERLAHAGENLLSRLRDGELPVTTEATSALLAMVDTVRELLDRISASGSDEGADVEALVARLTALQSGQPAPAPGAAGATAAGEAAAPAAPPEPEDRGAPRVGELLVAAGEASVADVAEAFTRQAAGDDRPIGEVLVANEAVTPNAVAEALRAQEATAAETIRIDVALLDGLIDLVGELVLARNQLVQQIEQAGDPALIASSQRLHHITSEIQEAALRTRMQPIGNVFGKFSRVVRDVAVGVGKDVRLEVEGEDTELDKSVLEAIKDPLTHLVRNAVDHGIEAPEQREAAGKPRQGRLLVRAFHEGGQVNIEIADDGAGIDVERVRQKAVAKGLLSAEEAANLSEREVVDLIFLPGLSTAEQVTNISGRGVGMDVVRTNIERIGGTVDVTSVPGAGTSFLIKIPLTLAIVPALVVGSAGGRYCIPQVNLLELVRVEPEDVATGIEWLHGVPVHRLRGRLLPLVDLAAELGAEPWLGRTGDQPVNIVVLSADGRELGLVVERIADSVEIVVKPLGRYLQSIPLFAGATIMGDGEVALILDAVHLAQRAGLAGEGQAHAADALDVRDAAAAGSDDGSAVLLLGTADGGRLALPLDEVDRLEEFPASAIEEASGRRVVQYRGGILPLVDLGGGLATGAETLQVIVHRDGDRLVGFVVADILDIVHERCELQPSTRHGVLGTAVLAGRVTDVIDVRSTLEGVR